MSGLSNEPTGKRAASWDADLGCRKDAEHDDGSVTAVRTFHVFSCCAHFFAQIHLTATSPDTSGNKKLAVDSSDRKRCVFCLALQPRDTKVG